MKIFPPVEEAIFIREKKNRFLCEIEINGTIYECYVSSSCRLSNLLSLNGQKVLVQKHQNRMARTKYTLFAVYYKRSYIILNVGFVNTIIGENIKTQWFSTLGERNTIHRERFFGEYKSDLYIEDSNTIIEIKSLISPDKTAQFATINSSRMSKQFRSIQKLLTSGQPVLLVIVSLNPYTKKIVIGKASPIYKELKLCSECGMEIMAVSLSYKDNTITIKNQLEIEWDS